jgi:hypothetical protein
LLSTADDGDLKVISRVYTSNIYLLLIRGGCRAPGKSCL